MRAGAERIWAAIRRRPVGVLATGALVAVSVWLVTFPSGDEARRLPPPSSTAPTLPEPTTSSIDLSRVALAPVRGQTTTTFATTGDAVLAGVVTGPDGPVPGAVVRVERLIGDAPVQTNEVRAGADGAWQLQGAPGGRFRVRAYLPPALTTAEPTVFFLADGEARQVDLQVEQVDGLVVVAGTTPVAPFLGSSLSLGVRVTARTVGEDGIARATPLPGVGVRVRTSGWTELQQDAVAVTDAEGLVVFAYRCDRVGQPSATALIDVVQQPAPTTAPEQVDPAAPPTSSAGPTVVTESFPLDVPPCAPPPTTTTAAPTTGEDDSPATTADP